MLDEQQRTTLLQIAREAVQAAIGHQRYAPTTEDAELQKPGAAFVTLKKCGELRGCIGTIEPREPLIENVAHMARAAALEDPRFPPVTSTEIPDLTIDISVLSHPEPVTDVNAIEIGRHGLIIEAGHKRGLLLPQVPVEWGWSRDEFLDHTCLKAGLPKGSWRTGAALYAFEAEVFGERE